MENQEDNTDNVNNFQKLQSSFSTFLSLTNKTLISFNNSKDIAYYKIIYIQLLQRLFIGIYAIDTLFERFKKHRYLKYPIGLQMRTCLLDSITIYYLIPFIDKNDDKKFREQIARLDKLVAKEFCTSIEEEIKTKKLMPDEYKEDFKLNAAFFPENFTKGDNPKRIKNIEEIKPNKMVESFKGTQWEWFGDCYAPYKYYCKYEHFNSISKIMLEHDTDYEFDKLVYSYFHVLQAVCLTYHILEIDKEIIEKIKNLRDSIHEIEPLFKFENLKH